MKKSISALVVICSMVLALLLASCASQGSTTPPPTTQPTTTSPATTTPTPSPTPTTTPPLTTTETTVPPTTTEHSPFQGSLDGTWTGESGGSPVSGTFSIIIDESGGVEGTFTGSFSGSVVGQVDVLGNLNTTGTALIGGMNVEVRWEGTLTVSGNAMSGNGTWTGPFMAGTFTGAGTTTQ